jgi:hypothetical protein
VGLALPSLWLITLSLSLTGVCVATLAVLDRPFGALACARCPVRLAPLPSLSPAERTGWGAACVAHAARVCIGCGDRLLRMA